MRLDDSRRPLSDLEIVQNPALGAFSIWHFGLGFQTDNGQPASFPLAFLVLPLIFHGPTLEVIGSTHRSSGLALLVAKLAKERENLLAVHERALLLRKLTLQSIGVGIGAGLITVDYQAATLRANKGKEGLKKPTLPERLKSVPGAAEKLGYWFSKTELNQIAVALMVNF